MHCGLKLHEIDAQSTEPFGPPLTRSLAPLTHSLRRTARFARAFRCAHLIARSLTHSRSHGKETYVNKLNASISYSFNPLCGGGSNGDEKLDSIKIKKAAAALVN